MWYTDWCDPNAGPDACGAIHQPDRLFSDGDLDTLSTPVGTAWEDILEDYDTVTNY
jgi:hypothetical protein